MVSSTLSNNRIGDGWFRELICLLSCQFSDWFFDCFYLLIAIFCMSCPQGDHIEYVRKIWKLFMGIQHVIFWFPLTSGQYLTEKNHVDFSYALVGFRLLFVDNLEWLSLFMYSKISVKVLQPWLFLSVGNLLSIRAHT